MQKQLKYSIKSCSKKFHQGKEENAKNEVFFPLYLQLSLEKNRTVKYIFAWISEILQ